MRLIWFSGGVLTLLGASLWALITFTPASHFLASPFANPRPVSDWADTYDLARASVPRDGGRLSYVRAGSRNGRRVLFVHGAPGYAGDFRDQLRRVPGDRDYVTVDRPGYGFSPPYRALPSLADQASALAPLLDTPDGRGVILVGFSLGGPVAVRTALDYPDRVAGLVLASSNLNPALEPWEWFNEVASWWIVAPFLQSDWRIANQELAPHKKELEALVPRLGGFTGPAAILHSRDDSLVPLANTDFMQSQMTGATFVWVRIVEGDSHMVPIHRPDLLAHAIDAVIAALETGGRQPSGAPPQPLESQTHDRRRSQAPP